MNKKHTKVSLRVEDIKGIIQTFEYIKWQNGKKHEHNKLCNRIIRQCKKSLEDES